MDKENKYPKRVQFPNSKQRVFVEQAMQHLGLSEVELGALLGVHRRTVNDWKREKTLMPLPVLEKLCEKMSIAIPSDVEVKEPFWHIQNASKLGHRALMEKYGAPFHLRIDQEYRKEKWREWWEKEGKFTATFGSISRPKDFIKPQFSQDLAEFVGIMLGDGGITQYQLKVTLSSLVDAEYSEYVQGLIQNLFSVPVFLRQYPRHNFLTLTVSRVGVVYYCNEVLGLHIGNKLKQGLDIPDWVKREELYMKRCLRGLVDTDGCIFYERHVINGKRYSYPRLNFTSASPLLVKSVVEILEYLGFSPRVRRKGRAVQLEKKEEIRQYLDVIGTSNPKHLQRFLSG